MNTWWEASTEWVYATVEGPRPWKYLPHTWGGGRAGAVCAAAGQARGWLRRGLRLAGRQPPRGAPCTPQARGALPPLPSARPAARGGARQAGVAVVGAERH